MIDDLVTSGVTEPYRMFTSRAEYRLHLREDNADIRLTEIGRNLGLVKDQRWNAFTTKMENIDKEQKWMASTSVQPQKVDQTVAQEVLGQPLTKDASLEDLLRRPEVTYSDLLRLVPDHDGANDEAVINQLEIQARYSGYLERQQDEIERRKRNENTDLPLDIDYSAVRGLSNEVCQKLMEARPTTIGQASRISGVTPAAISLLLVYMKKRTRFAA